MSDHSATARAEKIRARLSTIVENRDRVLELIREARDNDDATALGYPSWTAYVTGEFGGLLPKLAAGERIPLASAMRALGMPTRAIAPVLGVGKSTVDRDLATVPSGTLDVEIVASRDGRTRPAVRTAPPPSADDLRRRAAWQPFRALMSNTVAEFIAGTDALIAGHEWNGERQIDSRAVAITRLRELQEATRRVLAAWDDGTTIRRIK